MMKATGHMNRVKKKATRAVALLQMALLIWPSLSPLCAQETLAGHHVKVAPVNPHQIKPNPVGKTETIKTRGHAPTVNIQTPNAKGLSMNLVETFHVKEWTHINNCHTRDCLSQRAERVLGNPHLAQSGPARLVVMEVTGRQRSQLHDRLEMVGKSADFVLVNPNGIHASGAGFVNMPRVTLSTGSPFFDAEQQLLRGLDVSQGRIVIGKEGLALNGVKALDLIARKVEFRGKIREHLAPHEGPRSATTDVRVSAGAQVFDYETRTPTQKASPHPDKPSWGIDSSAVGGLYAGRITLVATEDGVGVKAPAHMISHLTEADIQADGNLLVQNLESPQGAKIKSHQGKVTQAPNTQLISGGITHLEAKKQIHLREGSLVHSKKEVILQAAKTLHKGSLLSPEKITVKGDLTASKESLIRSDGDISIKGSHLANAGTIKAIKKMVIKGEDRLVNSGRLLSASDVLSLTGKGVFENKEAGLIKSARSLHIDGFQTLKSGAQAHLEAETTLTLQGEDIEDLGTTLAKGKITINGHNLSQGGSLWTGDTLTLTGQNFLNTGQITAESTITGTLKNLVENSGEITSEAHSLKLTGSDLKNSGTIKSHLALTGVFDQSVSNTGTLESTTSDLVVKGKTLFENLGKGFLKAGKKLLVDGFQTLKSGAQAHLEAETTLTLQGEDIEDLGTTLAKGKITINGYDLIQGGSLWTGDTLTLTGQNLLSRGQITAESTITGTLKNLVENSGEIMSEGGFLTLTGSDLKNSGTLKAHNTVRGLFSKNFLNQGDVISEKGALSLTGLSFNNSGTLTSYGDLRGAFLQDVLSTGTLHSEKSEIFLKGGLFVNEGQIKGRGRVTVEGRKALTNRGDIVSEEASLILTARDLTNSGFLASFQALKGTFEGVLLNEGKVFSQAGMISLTGSDLTNQGPLKASGSVVAILDKGMTNTSHILSDQGDIVLKGSKAFINGRKGLIKSGGFATLEGESFQNAGLVQSHGPLTATFDQGILNTGHIISEADTLSLKSATLTNSGLLKSFKKLTSTLDTTLVNSGEIRTDQGTLSLTGSETIENQDEGLMSAGGALLLTGFKKVTNALKARLETSDIFKSEGGDVENRGEISGKKGLILQGKTFTQTGTLWSGDDLSLSGLSLRNSGVMTAVKSLTVTLQDSLDNEKKMISGAKMDLSAREMTNANRALLKSEQDLSFAGETLINRGEIFSQGHLSTSLSDSIQNEGLIFSQRGMTLQFDHGLYNITLDPLNAQKEAQILSYGDIFFQNRHGERSEWVENVSARIETLSPEEAMGSSVALTQPAIHLKTNSFTNKRAFIKVDVMYESKIYHHPDDYGHNFHITTPKFKETESAPQAFLISRGPMILDTLKSHNQYSTLTAGDDIDLKETAFHNDFFDLKEVRKGYIYWAMPHTESRGGLGGFLDGDGLGYHRVYHHFSISKTIGRVPALVQSGGTIRSDKNASFQQSDGYQQHTHPDFVTEKNIKIPQHNLQQGAQKFMTSFKKSPLLEINLHEDAPTLFTLRREMKPSFMVRPAARPVAKPFRHRRRASVGQIPTFTHIPEDAPIEVRSFRHKEFEGYTKPFMERVQDPFATDPGLFYETDYFLNHLNLFKDTPFPQKRLADRFIESRFVGRQVQDLTGARFLKGYDNQMQMYLAMQKDALGEAKRLNLAPGITLSAEQQERLSKNIIWYQREIVEGQEVLVPHVYLQRLTLEESSLEAGLVMGKRIDLKGTALLNEALIYGEDGTVLDIDKGLLNSGHIDSGGTTMITVAGDLSNQSGLIDSESGTTIKANSVHSQTNVHRTQVAQNYSDTLQRGSLLGSRSGNLTIETEKDLTSGGDTLNAGGDLTLTSKGHQTLTSQSLTQHAEVHQKGVDYDQTSRRHKKTTLTSGGKITLKSGGNTVLQGVDATFKEGLSVQAKGTLESAPVYDGDSLSLDVKSKGTFGSYESHEQSQTLQVNPNTFAGQGDIAFTSQGKLTVQANKLATDKEVTLSSTQDTVHMKAAQSVSAHQKSENSSNMITQTQSGHGYVDERTHLSQIEAAKVTIKSKKGTTVEVGPQGVGAGPDLAWAQALMKEKGITWHQIQEEHKAWSYSQTSLTPGAAAVLGGAINLATAGTLTPLAGTIVSNLAVNLVNNGGRLDRAFKATFTGDGLKSIVKSYVMNELFQGADANSDFSERLAQNAMRASASAGIDMALYGTDFKDALRSAAVNTVADTVAQEVSRQIGAEYGKDDSALNYATHKLAHGAVGAGVGALRGSLAKDAEGGAFAGAMGAVIGEVIAESQQEKIQGRVLERVKELESQGNTITPELIHDITRQEASGMMNAASFSSAVAAFAAGKDPSLASNASNDAVENNSLMQILGAVWTAYEFGETWIEKDLQTATEELAENAVINVATGAAGKIGGKVATKVIDKIPGGKKAREKAGEALGETVDKVKNSKAGKAVGDVVDKVSDKVSKSKVGKAVGEFVEKVRDSKNAIFDELSQKVSAKFPGLGGKALAPVGGAPLPGNAPSPGKKVASQGGKEVAQNAPKKHPEPKKQSSKKVDAPQKKHSNVGEEYGRRPKGHVRTNQELVQDVATRSEKNIGGTGHVAGTKKHKYAEEVLKRYQRMHGDRGLKTEQRWKNGEVWKPGDGLKDSIVKDVRDEGTHKLGEKMIYDYKYTKKPGGARRKQMRNFKKHGDPNAGVSIINPKKPSPKE